ncbi:MAG TPA: hypothetical protein VF800_24520 [Telluria sp.]
MAQEAGLGSALSLRGHLRTMLQSSPSAFPFPFHDLLWTAQPSVSLSIWKQYWYFYKLCKKSKFNSCNANTVSSLLMPAKAVN